MLVGKCLCGVVRYSVEGPFRYAGYCHCSRCRAGSGSTFSAFAGIEKDKLRVTDGDESITLFELNPDNIRSFCRLCGSQLFALVRDGQFFHVTMGTRSTTRAFARSSASWSARKRRGMSSPTRCRNMPSFRQPRTSSERPPPRGVAADRRPIGAVTMEGSCRPRFTNSLDRSARARWTIAELGIPFESIAGREVIGSPELKAVSPLGKVPGIVHDGRPLFESAAICTWLADSHPEKSLIAPSGSWPGAARPVGDVFCFAELEWHLWSTARNTSSTRSRAGCRPCSSRMPTRGGSRSRFLTHTWPRGLS